MSASRRVVESSLAAADYVRHSLAVELDGSRESLAFVDHYAGRVGGVSDEVLALVATALGAYFGEVVIACLGGRWHAGEDDDPAGWTVTLDAAPIRFHPVALAAEAVRKADLDDWDSTIEVPSAWESAVGDALEAGGPVAQDYYYSLTGRLESIEQAASVLTELRRRGAESSPDPAGDDEAPDTRH